MEIVKTVITVDELNQLAKNVFGDLIKAVVDVDRELIAVDAELQSDLEALLLEDGSKQNSLWGINFYPEIEDDDFVEFDSMINVRPSQGNMSRGVDSKEIRKNIISIVNKRVKR